MGVPAHGAVGARAAPEDASQSSAACRGVILASRPAYFPGEEIFNRGVSGQGRQLQPWREAGSTRSLLSPRASPRVTISSSCCVAAGRPKTAPIAPTAGSRWELRCSPPEGRSSRVRWDLRTPPGFWGAPSKPWVTCEGVAGSSRGAGVVCPPPLPPGRRHPGRSQRSQRMGK